MIKKFKRIEGRGIETICGQNRYGFSRSDFEDMYELIEWAERGGYQGSELLFYDFHTGEVYKPFDKKRNVVYGRPVYKENFIYFLQADYDAKVVTLFRYMPEEVLEKVTEFKIEEVNLYNLEIIGNPLFVVSQNQDFHCYYPETFSFSIHEQETVLLIEDGKVYCERWIEEGWDDTNGCATDTYRYYDKIIVRDFEGNIVSEEIGCLNESENGEWWIS